MAKNQVNLSVKFNFTSDKTSFDTIKKQIASISQIADLKLDPKAAESLKKDMETLTKAISDSFNKNTKKMDFKKVWEELGKNGLDTNALNNSFRELGIDGSASFRQIENASMTFQKQVKHTDSTVSKLGKTLGNTLRWTISSTVINSISSQFQKAYYFAKDLDRTLTDIRIVSGLNAKEMQLFAQEANTAAKALKTSTLEYADASLVYFQQGLSSIDVEKMTKATIIGANIAGESTEEMSNLLTSAMNGYQLAADKAIMVTDKLAAVGASTAADFFELATGMSKVSSMANTAGVSMDQLNGQLATIVSVTKESPESIGTSLKTIYGRMLAFKNNTTSMMEDEDGELFGAPAAEAALEKFSQAIGKQITLFDTMADGTKQLRDLGTVIDEIGNAWQTTNDKEAKFGLATALAGSRQQNRLIALFNSWGMYQDAVETSMNAEGTAFKQNALYMDSYQGRVKKLQSTIEDISLDFIRPEDMKWAIEGLTTMVEKVDNIANSIGNLQGVFGILAGFISNSFGGKIISNLFSSINQLRGNLSNEDADKNKYRSVAKIYGADKANDLSAQSDALLREQQAIEKKLTLLKLEEQYLGQVRAAVEQVSDAYEQSGKKQPLSMDTLENLASKIKNSSAELKQELKNISNIEKEYARSLKAKDIADTKRKAGKTLTGNDVVAEKQADAILAQYNQDSINKLKEQFLVLLKEELNLKDDSLNSDVAVAEKLKEINALSSLENTETENEIIKRADSLNKMQNAMTVFFTSYIAMSEKAKDDSMSFSEVLKSGLSTIRFILPAFSSELLTLGANLVTAAKGGTTLVAVMGMIGTAIGPLIAGFAVAAGITLIVKAIDQATFSAEEASEKFLELNAEVQKLGEQKATLSPIIKELDDLKSKYSLTSDELERYINLRNQLAEQMPELVAFYDQEGNAVLIEAESYAYLIEQLEESIRLKNEEIVATAERRLQEIAEDDIWNKVKHGSTLTADEQAQLESYTKEMEKLSYQVYATDEAFQKAGAAQREFLSKSTLEDWKNSLKEQGSYYTDVRYRKNDRKVVMSYDISYAKVQFDEQHAKFQKELEEATSKYRLTLPIETEVNNTTDFDDLMLVFNTESEKSASKLTLLNQALSDLDLQGKLSQDRIDALGSQFQLSAEDINSLTTGSQESKKIIEERIRLEEESTKKTKENLKVFLQSEIARLQKLEDTTDAFNKRKQGEQVGLTAEQKRALRYLQALLNEMNTDSFEQELLDAQTANDNFAKELEKTIAALKSYGAALSEYDKNGAFSSQTLVDIIENHKELIPYLTDEEELYNQIQLAMEEEKEAFIEMQEEKLSKSEEFFESAAIQNNEHFKLLAEKYAEDIANAGTTAKAKLAIEADLASKMSQIWKDYFKAKNGAEVTDARIQMEELWQEKKLSKTGAADEAWVAANKKYHDLVTQGEADIAGLDAIINKYANSIYSSYDFFGTEKDKKTKSSKEKDPLLEWIKEQEAILKHQYTMGEITAEKHYNDLLYLYNTFIKDKAKYVEEDRRMEEELLGMQNTSFQSRFNNSISWIDERNKRLDWGTDNELAALDRISAYTDEAYKKGKMLYRDYIEYKKQLDDKYFDFYKRQEEARASILDLVIDALKDQDDLRQENLENTQDDIEEQIELVEDAEKEKLKARKDTLKKIREAEKDALKQQMDDAFREEDRAEKVAEIQALQGKLGLTLTEKERYDIQQKIAKLQKELNREDTKYAIEQKIEEIDAIQEMEEEAIDIKLDEIDKQTNAEVEATKIRIRINGEYKTVAVANAREIATETEKSLDRMKDKTRDWVAEAKNIMTGGSDSIMDFLKNNLSDFSTYTEMMVKELQNSLNMLDLPNVDRYQVKDPSEFSSEQNNAHSNAQSARQKLVAAGYSQGVADISSYGAAGAEQWYNTYIKDRTDLSGEIKGWFKDIVDAKKTWESSYHGGGVVGGQSFNPQAEEISKLLKGELILTSPMTRNLSEMLLSKSVSNSLTQSDQSRTYGDTNISVILKDVKIASDMDITKTAETLAKKISILNETSGLGTAIARNSRK